MQYEIIIELTDIVKAGNVTPAELEEMYRQAYDINNVKYYPNTDTTEYTLVFSVAVELDMHPSEYVSLEFLFDEASVRSKLTQSGFDGDFDLVGYEIYAGDNH